MPLVDTHCHLNLLEEKGMPAVEALDHALRQGVSSVIQIATDIHSSSYNKELSGAVNSENAPLKLYWTAGLHPESAKNIQTLDQIANLIYENRNDEYFMGIGETGLDYFHTTEFEKEQKQSFQKHLDLAEELSLPVILHLRDGKSYSPDNTRAYEDALKMISDRKNVKGVLHCFTYSLHEARPFIDMGWFVSYSGIVTYKNAEVLQEGAAALPLDRLLVETDAPYLSPIPVRGNVNEPAHVFHTLNFIADLRHKINGEDPEYVKNAIYENSLRFINLKNTAEGKTYA